jgi:hypothetical protein
MVNERNFSAISTMRRLLLYFSCGCWDDGQNIEKSSYIGIINIYIYIYVYHVEYTSDSKNLPSTITQCSYSSIIGGPYTMMWLQLILLFHLFTQLP